jgi:flagellar biosynthesis/type III secretory pathway protein FliH
MSLSRLVSRDFVKPDEVCLYPQRDLEGDPFEAKPDPPGEVEYGSFEFDSLDGIELAPVMLLSAAQERARQIIADAERQAAELREKTLRENAEQGREEAKKELMPALVAFADAGQSLIVFEEQLVARHTPHLVELALAIAEKVIGKAIEEDPGITASILERAKQEIIDAKRIRIWLNPADHRILAELRPDLVKLGAENGRTIEVVACEEVGRGGCRLETESGLVDATIPTQMDEIRRQLLE